MEYYLFIHLYQTKKSRRNFQTGYGNTRLLLIIQDINSKIVKGSSGSWVRNSESTSKLNVDEIQL